MLLRVSIWFLAVLLGVAVGQQRNGGSCSRDRMRQCEEGLRRNTQRRITDLQRVEMSAHCVNVRDDFNCLLRETRCLSTESERNRNGDTLRSGLKYIRDGCDTAGGSWRDSSCFIGDGMKNCESSYPLGGVQYASFNPETCRKYNLFFDCVMDNIRSRCRPEDDMLLGQYLVDSGQDLAWNCGDRDTDRNRDDRYNTDRRYGNNDRNYDNNDNYNRGGTYNRENDRYPDRDRDRYPSGGQYGGNGYGRNDYVGSDITCCRNERCDRNRHSQCRDSLSRAIDSRMTGNLDRQRCRKVRDDFNCLMWQTSHCTSREDRDRDNDVFRRARDFISRQCDTYERWTDNSCYKTTEMQRCESQLSSTRGGANYEACRSFLTFRDCMTEEIQRRCTRDDDLFQGAYMVDKAQEMSWQCGSSGSGNQYNNDRNPSGDRGQYGDRNSYSTFDRKDQYDRQDGYDSNPVHLEDDDSNCAGRIRTYSDACKATMDNKRREFYSENDYDRKQKINCCSVREYRNCLYDATRRYCQTERSRVVDNLMAGFRHHLTSDSCSRIYDNECSSSCKNQLSLVLLTICIALLSALFSFRR